VQPQPRRSARSRQAPSRLGFDGSQGYGYLMAPSDSFHLQPLALKANASDPDTFSFDEAMQDTPNLSKWMEAAANEIASLEKNGTWKVVPTSEAKTKILPGTWVFKRKCTPDGTIKKYKARYCVKSDLEEGEPETFAPVIARSTVQLFLVLSLTLGWSTCSIDFSNAFVQATLQEPVWIYLPRGFKAPGGQSCCLQLLKSLYGLSVSPRLWYEHVSDALIKQGFKPCTIDPCLLFKDTVLVVLYVDDVGIAYANERDLNAVLSSLEKQGLTFTREGTFTDFLVSSSIKTPKTTPLH
jgi:Reverse transcriptase (RNA-dependent DNA polymerase)